MSNVELRTSKCTATLVPGKRYRIRYEVRTGVQGRPAIRVMVGTFGALGSMGMLHFDLAPVVSIPHGLDYQSVVEVMEVDGTVLHHAPRKPSSMRRVAK